MSITIITAADNNGGIGYKGKLPWRIPAELAHFHRTVADMVTVCGVKTYPTLPKTLRARTLVWSGRGWGDKPTVNTDEVLSLAQMHPVAIIGGAATYAEFLPYADKIMLSRIYNDFEVDTYFPGIDHTHPRWEIIAGDAYHGENGQYEWGWFELVRKAQP
jgi:dihydrofolate reductase